jgi:endoglucanase
VGSGGGSSSVATGGTTSSAGSSNAGGATTAAGATSAGGAASMAGTPGSGGQSSGDGGRAGTNGGGGSSGGSSGSAGASQNGGAANGGSAGVASGGAPAGDASAGGAAAIGDASSFHCVNWADPRDNFVDGLLALSGLSSSTDTYATVQSKATDVLSEFQTKLEANGIRIPINEPTVTGAWWKAYKAVIDTAAARGMKVIVAYWAFHNGKPDNASAFIDMWRIVVSEYQSNNLVYFDVHNEPYGYGDSWKQAAADWLTAFPNVPRGRVIIAGTGYDDNIKAMAGDSRFAGCLLQLHIYGFWHTSWTTRQQWRDDLTSSLGSYAARTIVGEWGAPMTTGTDYGVDTDGDAFRSYVRAASDVMHGAGVGSCYWPGLRNGDSYSMTRLNDGTPLTLAVTNTSGLARLHWAWKL